MVKKESLCSELGRRLSKINSPPGDELGSKQESEPSKEEPAVSDVAEAKAQDRDDVPAEQPVIPTVS